MKIKLSYLSLLSKLEFSGMAKGVIQIVEKFDAKALDIENIATLLTNEQTAIDQLVMRHGRHPLSREILTLQKDRRRYIKAIIYHLNALEAADLPQKRESMRIAAPMIRAHFKNRLKENDKKQSGSVIQFFIQVDSDRTLKDELTALGFDEYLAELKRVQDELDRLSKERVNSISKRPKMNTSEIKRNFITALNNLFARLELGKLENPELNYDSLLNELNTWLSSYQSLVKGRLNSSKSEEKSASSVGKTSATPKVIGIA